LISFHDLPLMMDVLHNAEFLFDNPFVFRDRYNNDPDYFTFKPSNVRAGERPPCSAKASMGGDDSDTGFVPDINQVRLQEAKSRV